MKADFSARRFWIPFAVCVAGAILYAITAMQADGLLSEVKQQGDNPSVALAADAFTNVALRLAGLVMLLGGGFRVSRVSVSAAVFAAIAAAAALTIGTRSGYYLSALFAIAAAVFLVRFVITPKPEASP